MKAVSCFLSILLALPALALACSCIAIDFESALTLTDSAWRGKVTRRLKNSNNRRIYEVSVLRLYKGCNFKANDHIIVTTRTNSAACGIELKVNTTYSFTGYRSTMGNGIKNQLGSNPKKVSSVFGVTICDFVTKWTDVSEADKRLLNTFDNSKCVAKCNVGGDCPKDQYCDFGTCKSLTKCSTPLVNCVAAPCSVSTCTAPSTCFDNYCGGCNAIFLDTANTRIC
jgi:Tissue inhibitor of metalloproteinase